jgi:hypothetical protein
MRYSEMMKFVTRAEEGGRKAFSGSELDPSYYLERSGGFRPVSGGIQKDLMLSRGIEIAEAKVLTK